MTYVDGEVVDTTEFSPASFIHSSCMHASNNYLVSHNPYPGKRVEGVALAIVGPELTLGKIQGSISDQKYLSQLRGEQPRWLGNLAGRY